MMEEIKENNDMPDIFRKEYRTLTDKERDLLTSIKEKARSLYDDFEAALDKDRYALMCAREIALAKTNLEQAVMWAVKGITG